MTQERHTLPPPRPTSSPKGKLHKRPGSSNYSKGWTQQSSVGSSAVLRIQTTLPVSTSNWNKVLKTVCIQERSRGITHTAWELCYFGLCWGDKSQTILLNIYIFTFPDYVWCQSIPISVKERSDCYDTYKQPSINKCLRTQEQVLDIIFKNGKRFAHLTSSFFCCRPITSLSIFSISLIQFVKLQMLLNEEIFSELFMFGIFCKDMCGLTQTTLYQRNRFSISNIYVSGENRHYIIEVNTQYSLWKIINSYCCQLSSHFGG